MSIIRNTTFTYQEYKAYRQTHKDCGISGRTPYSMIGNNSETDNKKILENTVITVPHSNAKYEMTAEYADNFSDDTPFIKVTISNADNKQECLINIDEINLRNASAVEVFALFSYADAHEKNMGFSSSIWSTLTGYVKNNAAYEQKLDWTAMVEETRDGYMSSGLYKQVSDGNKLISLFEQYGMPEKVEMDYMDAEHWIPANNYVCQLFTDKKSAWIEIDGSGSINYIDFQDESSNWSMKITQEQLAKALELKSLESAEGLTEFYLYISDKSFWEGYLNSDMSLDDLRGAAAKTCQTSTYTDFVAKFPDAVREAWEKAKAESGADEFYIDGEGNLLYLSEFAKRYFLSYINNETMDFLGESVDSLLKFARESLERLENSNDAQDDFYARRFGIRNFDIQKLKDSEKLFYEKLIENLLYIIS
ncbi:MAG: hypothetical protein K2J04_10880 [Lachnospiraceae bacterium]|nr:hypothetical protein [Lachnospiraceae bacterium]